MTTVAPPPATRPAGKGSPAAGGPTISVRGLWKVFGPAEQRLTRRAGSAAPAADQIEEAVRDHGGTVAVGDVSLTSGRARCSSSWACPAAASRPSSGV